MKIKNKDCASWACSKCGANKGRHDQWFEGDICEDCVPQEKKFTLKEICKAWKHMYGENFRTEYSGLYKYLKKQK